MLSNQFVSSVVAISFAATTLTFSSASVAAADPRCSKSGTVVQFRRAELTDKKQIFGLIELDDSIPQIGEGTSLIQLPITPVCANSRLLIEALVYVSEVTNVSDNFVLALFRNAGPGAIAAGASNLFGGVGGIIPVPLSAYVPSRALKLTTFKLRGGANNQPIDVNAGTNRNIASRGLSGAMRSYLQATEIVP